MPLKFAFGTYVNDPSEFSVSVPLLTSVSNTAVNGSPSASVSFASTPGAPTVSVTSSSVVYASSFATGGWLAASTVIVRTSVSTSSPLVPWAPLTELPAPHIVTVPGVPGAVHWKLHDSVPVPAWGPSCVTSPFIIWLPAPAMSVPPLTDTLKPPAAWSLTAAGVIVRV